MKDETDGEAITEFVGLQPKTYLFVVDDNSEYKKAKGMNEKAVENKKIGTYEIKKILLSCFDDKIYTLINRCNTLALGYLS